MICFKCGRLGHLADDCPFNASKTSSKSSTPPDSQPLIANNENEIITEKTIADTPEQDSTFGEWMLVKKPPRRRPNSKPDKSTHVLSPSTSNSNIFNFGKDHNNNSGSRFDLLTEQNPNNDIPTPISNRSNILASSQNTTQNQFPNQPIISNITQTNNSNSQTRFHSRSLTRSTKYSKKNSVPNKAPQNPAAALKDITNLTIINNNSTLKSTTNNNSNPTSENHVQLEANNNASTHILPQPPTATTSTSSTTPSVRNDTSHSELHDFNLDGDARTLYGGDGTGEPNHGHQVQINQEGPIDSPIGDVDTMEC
ncbi:hypothetical protein RND81_02G115100 [Saponaria officinalis]|uniref:CCHC-type domain-containing protein n=1 Tax=Saponaria officinalis TaxID=3572 RepID=A0AAW1MM73_SAPOF